MRLWRWSILLLLGAATAALGGRLSFQEHAAVQESLARVHPRMRASWLRAHGLDDSYYTTFRRPESTGLVCRGRWPWGPSWELAGRDTLMYLGSGSGVRILSIADSVHPRMLGQINARGLVSQVAVQDSLLFVACGSWGAQIYSVADPTDPRELGSMDAVIGDLCVRDTFCYTVGGDSLRIYNVASPSQPSLLGAVRDSGDLVTIANGYAFSAGRWVMNIYNVADPAHPTWANSRGGPAYAMFVMRNLLFCTGYDPDYLSALNITDPLSITEVGRVNGYGGEGLYVDDSCAYLSCTNDHHGLFVIDVSDSSRPSLRDSIDPEGAEEWEPHVPRYPGYGYLADDFGGLLTLDLHDESDVSIAWSGYKASQAMDIIVDGQRAYVANQYSGVQIVSVVDPAKPISLGLFDTIGTKMTATVVAQDSFAFAGMSGMTGRRYLLSLDVLDPANPVVVAQESCRNPPQDMVLRDTLLYCAEMNQFQVFNVARPREPVLVGSCAGVGINARNIALGDSIAYVAMGSGGLASIDISDPAAPSVIGSWSGRSSGVSLSDTIAYVAGPYTGLVSLSVADPSLPRVIDSLYLSDTLWWNDVTTGGPRAYVGGERVLTVDISDPASLQVLGSLSPPYLAQRMTYAAPYLYTACLEAGVAIYETTSIGISERFAGSRRLAALRLWPSVARDEVRFALGVTARTADIAVFDISGKRLNSLRQQSAVKGGATEGAIDLSGLAAGVYVVRVEADGKSFTAKVVKTNRR
jgi:hypothetical protein